MKTWLRTLPALPILLLATLLFLATQATAQETPPTPDAERQQAQQGPQANPVSFELESYVVSEVTVDGNRQERFTPADTARPGQVVEYRIIATNTGETTLPAGTVIITGPIPDMTHYLDGSATPSTEEVLTEFTSDGTTWGEPPLMVAGARVEPEDFTAVRWTLLSELEPGEEETFIYRIVVE